MERKNFVHVKKEKRGKTVEKIFKKMPNFAPFKRYGSTVCLKYNTGKPHSLISLTKIFCSLFFICLVIGHFLERPLSVEEKPYCSSFSGSTNLKYNKI